MKPLNRKCIRLEIRRGYGKGDKKDIDHYSTTPLLPHYPPAHIRDREQNKHVF